MAATLISEAAPTSRGRATPSGLFRHPLVSHYRVRVNGDTATAAVKGYAYNVLDEDLGSGMWEVWGAYEIPLRRTDAGWRASGITFHTWHSRGDDSVRAHTLSS
jgi:hypothetical protein